MILIYGLGNNETQYLNTKHNIGRLVIENLAQQWDLSFTQNKGIHLAKNSNLNIWLAYSNGYMNNCGLPLGELIRYYKISPKSLQIMIIQDDSDQNSTAVKLTVGGGSAGHNGIISVYQHLASFGIEPNNIWRLKIGIRPHGNRLKSETFVLSANTLEDNATVNNVANCLYSKSNLISVSNLSKLQNLLNQKPNIKPILVV